MTEDEDEIRETGDLLVDDLAGESDYWLSITDAARVTRRQEITIRRWIAARALPVRRQRTGHNKRTRHVRASDLSKLTPIIDPTAAITGEPGNVDLMSIPQHQAQLYKAQQVQDQTIGQLQTQLADLGQEMSDQSKQQRQAIMQMRQDLAATGQQLAEQLQRTTTFWDEQLVQQRQNIEATWQVARTQLEKIDTELAQRLNATITHLTQQREADQAKAGQAQRAMQQQIAEHFAQQQEIRAEIQGVAGRLIPLQNQFGDIAQAIQRQAEEATQSVQAIQSALSALAQQTQAGQTHNARLELRLTALELPRRRRKRSNTHHPAFASGSGQ